MKCVHILYILFSVHLFTDIFLSKGSAMRSKSHRPLKIICKSKKLDLHVNLVDYFLLMADLSFLSSVGMCDVNITSWLVYLFKVSGM